MNLLACYPPHSALTYPYTGRHGPEQTLESNRAQLTDVLVCRLGFHHEESWRKLICWLMGEGTVLLLYWEPPGP